MRKSESDYDELIKRQSALARAFRRDQFPIASQKDTKPVIEDVIGLFLEGDTLKIAMDFIAFLRENDMNLRWHSANNWDVTGKKAKGINIVLGGTKRAWHSHLAIGDWQIGVSGLENKSLDELNFCDEMKAFVWDNVKPCERCCSCGPRRRTYAGKQFDESCGLNIKNPDAKGLEMTQKLILARRRLV